MNLLDMLAAVAVVVFVIARQVRGEPLRGKRLIVLPAVLAVVGLTSLGRSGRHPTATDIACIAVGALLAAGIGAAQGAALRLEPREGVLWARMPLRGLWWWLALVVSRLGMTAVAAGLHAHVASSSAPVLLLLGINRLGQAAVVTPRALAAGLPFAPERDGRPFDVQNLFGGRQNLSGGRQDVLGGRWDDVLGGRPAGGQGGRADRQPPEEALRYARPEEPWGAPERGLPRGGVLPRGREPRRGADLGRGRGRRGRR